MTSTLIQEAVAVVLVERNVPVKDLLEYFPSKFHMRIYLWVPFSNKIILVPVLCLLGPTRTIDEIIEFI